MSGVSDAPTGLYCAGNGILGNVRNALICPILQASIVPERELLYKSHLCCAVAGINSIYTRNRRTTRYSGDCIVYGKTAGSDAIVIPDIVGQLACHNI